MRRFRLPAVVLLLAALTLQAATFPRPATDVTINTTAGKNILLSQYRGKVVVLAFILTTCSHCQRTTGYLNKLQREFGIRGLQVIESAVEGDARNNVTGFVMQFQTPYPVGYTPDLHEVLAFMQRPPMSSPHMPFLAFIDRKGMIRAQHEGSEEPYFGNDQEQYLRADIEKLLNEGAPTAKSAPPKAPAPTTKK